MKVTLNEKDIQTAIRFWASAKFPQYDVALDRIYMLSGDIDVVLTEKTATGTTDPYLAELQAEAKL